ncbi:MAG: hypothetical protein ABII09_03960 [Planctomycetota bacterium]
MKKDSPNIKKNKFKKYLWPVISLTPALLVLTLVLTAYKPRRYAPVRIADKNLVSPYLTHQLMPDIYNNAQLGEPFEVVITQQGLNDIVARLPQPIRLNNITLADPQVVLMREQIILMATVRARPIDFFVTVELKPTIYERGLLNLHIDSIKLGAVSITPVARLISDKAYSNWLTTTGTEPNNLAAQVCRSLLRDEPFEPVFKTGGKQLRISKIDIETKGITAQLSPVPNKQQSRAERNRL